MRPCDIDDPDLPLDAVMVQWPQTIPVFLRHNMLCVGCLVNPFHTANDACEEYALEEAAFRAELRRAITS